MPEDQDAQLQGGMVGGWCRSWAPAGGRQRVGAAIRRGDCGARGRSGALQTWSWQARVWTEPWQGDALGGFCSHGASLARPSVIITDCKLPKLPGRCVSLQPRHCAAGRTTHVCRRLGFFQLRGVGGGGKRSEAEIWADAGRDLAETIRPAAARGRLPQGASGRPARPLGDCEPTRLSWRVESTGPEPGRIAPGGSA